MASSLASVSLEGALAARQLSAAAGRQEPLGSRAAALFSVLPRAQHRCASATARFVWRYRAWRQIKLQNAKPSSRAPGRAELPISSSAPHLWCRRAPNSCSRYEFDHLTQQGASKSRLEPVDPCAPRTQFGNTKTQLDALPATFDCCQTPPASRTEGSPKNRLESSLSQGRRCLAAFVDLQPLIACRPPPQ